MERRGSRMVLISVVPWGLFPEASMEAAFERTAAAGADGIELLNFDGFAPETLADMANDHGLEIAVAGAIGETTGIDNVSPAVVDPASTEQAIEDLHRSIDRAASANARNVLVTVGQYQDELQPHEQHRALVEVLRGGASAAEKAGVTVVPEVLNTRVDHPGYYLNSSYEAYEIVHAVDSPNIGVLYDIYHQQIMEGNIIDNLTANIEYVDHIHFADVPGRHEPGSGELHFENIFEALDAVGYEGFAGAELSPTGDPDETLRAIVNLAT